MHELSIAMQIIETVEENALSRKATVIREVELEIGELSGVEFDALNFAFEHAPANPLFKNAVFKIIPIKPLAQCLDCLNEFETGHYGNPCPKCQSVSTELIKGNELRIKSFSYD